MAIKQMDTTASGIKEKYLEPTAAALAKADGEKRNYYAGEVMRAAFARFAADCVGLSGKDRDDFMLQIMATPGWFGSNTSACRQAFEEKKGGKVADIRKLYGGL